MKTNKQNIRFVGIQIFLITLLLNLGLSTKAQNDSLFMYLDMGEISSGIFLSMAKSCQKPDGSEYDYLTRAQVNQIIFAFEDGQVNSADFIPDISQFREGLKDLNSNTGYIPITIIESKYQNIKANAINDELMEFDGVSLFDISGTSDSPYEESELLAFFVDHQYYHGQEHTFILDENYYLNNYSTIPESIEIDFDDGMGFRFISLNTPITIIYNEAIDRDIRLKITRDGGVKKGGNILKSGGGNSGLIPDPNSVPWPDLVDDSEHPYLYGSDLITGEWTMADAYTLTSDDGIFDKPFIFVEGIDFGTYQGHLENGTFGWFDFSSGESIEYPMMHDMPFFLEELRAKNYDIVFLDFEDGATYIQDNASTLVELINRCNEYKVGNEPLIVAGASMGGQVSRYALRWMEMNDMDHCTQMYISLDSPHTGANIPIGMQYLLRGLIYTGGEAGEKIWSTLFRPASRQLLVEQLPEEAGVGELGIIHYNQSSIVLSYEPVYNPGNIHSDYYSEIESMGLPQKTINVALSNGNNTGNSLGLSSQLLDFDCETQQLIEPLIDVEFTVQRCDVTGAPSASIVLNEVGVADDWWWGIPFLPALFYDKGYSYLAPSSTASLSYDKAAGGTRNTMVELIETINESLDDNTIWSNNFFTGGCHIEESEYEDIHSFIPTVSALGIEMEHLMTNLSTHPEIVSPFDYTYSPNVGNQAHSEVNPENINYMLDLIFSHHLQLPAELTINSDNNGVFNITGQNNAHIKDVTVYDGGELYINADIPSNFDGEDDVVPEAGNHIDVSPLTCSSYLTIGDNGLLHIGEGNVGGVDNTVALNITDGFTLRVEPGGKLVIDNNSKLIVKRGGEVYIEDETSLGYQGVIIVEPGGKVTIDGATVTSIGENSWEGIEVHGDKDLRQLPTSNQGCLVLKNGAVIENAECAVRLVKNMIVEGWDVDWTSTGGIVEASQTTFSNNHKDIEFLSYENHNAFGNPIANQSKFIRCTFKVDDNYSFSNISANVTSYKCHGLVFRGCTFSDERTDVERHLKRTGIYASNSTFTINEHCGVNDPVSGATCNGTRTRFENMGYGIQSWNHTNPLFTTKVKNSDFDDCWKGIHLTGITQTDIILNDFYITGTENLKYDYDGPVGLYLDNQCSNYSVTENTFHGPDATDGISVGVVVANGHSGIEEIYGNSFDNLYMATEALGQNRTELDDQYFGLVIKCNNFSNNVLDINVDDYYIASPVIGINQHQGELSSLSSELINNSFYNASYMEWNFRNIGEHLFYIRNSNETSHELIGYNTSALTQISILGEGVSCPSKVEPKSIEEKSLQLAEATDGLIEKQAELNALVDGGNTFALELEIMMTTDADAWANYLDLMSKAGYLSEEVLKEISQKEEGFTDAMIRNILVANAHAAKSKDVNDKLDERINPLPDYMLEQIKLGLTQISSKEYLQLQKAGHKINYDQAIQDALKIISDDELVTDKISVMVDWLTGTNDINWDYYLVDFYDANGMTNEADDILNALEYNYSLSNEETNELVRFVEYRTLINSWESSELNLRSLDDTNLALLENYSEGHDMAASRARSLLRFNEVLAYVPPIILPNDNDTKSMESSESSKSGFEEGILEVSPNPSKDFFNIHYRINSDYMEATAILMDNKGVFVKTIPLENIEDELLVPTQSIASGSYQLLLLVDGVVVLKESVTLL